MKMTERPKDQNCTLLTWPSPNLLPPSPFPFFYPPASPLTCGFNYVFISLFSNKVPDPSQRTQDRIRRTEKWHVLFWARSFWAGLKEIKNVLICIKMACMMKTFCSMSCQCPKVEYIYLYQIYFKYLWLTFKFKIAKEY